MERSRLRPFGLLFEKSLSDLIRGIRRRRDPELLGEYFKRVVAECRDEVRSPDIDVKAMAVLKLAYLEMYGLDMAWAAFHVLEVMASPKFQQKRIGYLAAMQSFRSDTELLMLTTNLIKTDLASASMQRVAIALSGLANIVTPFLAVDVSDDIVKMLNHSQPYVRKKAILAMYKVILQYPEALPATLPRLREKLDDEDGSVVSAAVNVVCELANQSASPRAYIELAPSLFDLLTTSKNNWCLIKILKLFAIFTVHEPRLKARVLPQVTALVDSTTAMSLLYECISCIIRGEMLGPDDYALARTCVAKLRGLVEERDPNLRFVGLEALARLARINQQFLNREHAIVLECIDDPDLAIRRKVLDMLRYLVDEDNLYDIVTQLLEQIRQGHTGTGSGGDSSGSGSSSNSQPIAAGASAAAAVAANSAALDSDYLRHVVLTITDICSANNYEFVPNFDWYLEVLVEMAQLSYARVAAVGDVVGRQLEDIAVRVRSVRAAVVAACESLAFNAAIAHRQPALRTRTLWVCGEYAGDYMDARPGAADAAGRQLIAHMLEGPPLEAIGVTALAKTFARWVQRVPGWAPAEARAVEDRVAKISAALARLAASTDSETQERAVQFLELFRLGAEAAAAHPAGSAAPPALLTEAFPALFSAFDITPVAADTQLRIAAPADLDLDTPIRIPDISFSDTEDEEDELDQPELAEPADVPGTRAHGGRLDPYYIGPANGDDAVDAVSTKADSQSPQSPVSGDSSQSGLAAATPAAPAAPAAAPRRRVPKVKVEIAQDEPFGGDGLSLSARAPAPVRAPSGRKPLFQVVSRLNALDMDSPTPEPEPAPVPSAEVLVTHKKVAKKKKVKTDKEKKLGEKKKKKKTGTSEPAEGAGVTEGAASAAAPASYL